MKFTGHVDWNSILVTCPPTIRLLLLYIKVPYYTHFQILTHLDRFVALRCSLTEQTPSWSCSHEVGRGLCAPFVTSQSADLQVHDLSPFLKYGTFKVYDFWMTGHVDQRKSTHFFCSNAQPQQAFSIELYYRIKKKADKRIHNNLQNTSCWKSTQLHWWICLVITFTVLN